MRLISTENRGLCARAQHRARRRRRGEIVAYIDDDAWPDPHWLRYLAHAFVRQRPRRRRRAEHPAAGRRRGRRVRRERARAARSTCCSPTARPSTSPAATWRSASDALEAIGGSTRSSASPATTSTSAGGSRSAGWTLGFSPARSSGTTAASSVRALPEAAAGYGKAEALLERKWPDKYNRGGHLAWAGRLYGNGSRPRRAGDGGGSTTAPGAAASSSRSTTARPSTLASLPLMPEWYLLIGVLALLSVVGIFRGPLVPWTAGAPVRVELLLLVAAALALAVKAVRSAGALGRAASPRRPAASAGVTAVLYLLQPVARLAGGCAAGSRPGAAAANSRSPSRGPAADRLERALAVADAIGCSSSSATCARGA